MSLDIPDAWVKAAVEHVAVQIIHRTPGGEIVALEIEPDAIEFSGGEAVAFIGHTPGARPILQCYRPESILGFAVTNRRFRPPVHGRWRAFVPLYESRGLASRGW
ncbi:hypothetical protein FGU65_08850 [Methanoculleus sp. FWC-SCC1]|uniref:Uncharacterized protein n=1 Tax=Methanoculleus frigidifontis TaxID=2584085 RepID=A0ABT8MAN4_9EURY|nr:hypothetical protein [Methanoculleus sp. FWC-SCC1]MDN7024992.1 hypothetical protein [Methanoculleus sp. FWC-SCC1]